MKVWDSYLRSSGTSHHLAVGDILAGPAFASSALVGADAVGVRGATSTPLQGIGRGSNDGHEEGGEEK